MDPVAKRILNSLKCPICGSQIDLIGWNRSEKRSKDANFSCVSDPEHYGIWLVHWEQPIRLEAEQVVVYEGRYQYQATQQHYLAELPINRTLITIREVDAERRVLDNKPIKLFTYQKHLFDFTKINRDNLVNRIKTILVFQ